MTLGRVVELWRYPVNGLQGEKLTETRVLPFGIPGDHLYAIIDARSRRVLDPKSHHFSWGETLAKPTMLELSAKLTGEPEGPHHISLEAYGNRICTTEAPGFNERISDTFGRSLELVRYPRFTESRVRSGRTLHLLTTASLDRIGSRYPGGDFSARRFRPNIVVATEQDTDAYAEEGWVGRDISVGGVRLRVEKPNVRCKVTTMRQPGIMEDPQILETIARENGGNLGVMCTAISEGIMRVGDSVALA